MEVVKVRFFGRIEGDCNIMCDETLPKHFTLGIHWWTLAGISFEIVIALGSVVSGVPQIYLIF